MKRVFVGILALIMLFTVITGCNNEKVNDNKKILLVTSFYPIYIFTQNIVDGVEEIDLQCMAEQNVGCLHDYQLLSKDARLLEEADVFIINGASMEAFLEDVYENVDSLKVIDSSKNVKLIENCEEHTHEEEAEHHGHNHSVNSHIWMSVDNAIIQVENISDELKSLYPQYEEQITNNTEGYIKRLNNLKAELLTSAKSIEGKKIITFHESYAYMANELSFNVVATVESHEGGEPSAKELAHLTEIMKNEGVKTLFVEPNYKGSAATILANETGAKVCVLNPVIQGENTKTAYEDIMKENMRILLGVVN